MPPNHELVREHALVVKSLHKRAKVFLLGRVSFDKIQNDGLHQSLNPNLAIVFYQLQERWLILRPRFDAVAFALKEAAEQDVVFVFGGDVHD